MTNWLKARFRLWLLAELPTLRRFLPGILRNLNLQDAITNNNWNWIFFSVLHSYLSGGSATDSSAGFLCTNSMYSLNVISMWSKADGHIWLEARIISIFLVHLGCLLLAQCHRNTCVGHVKLLGIEYKRTKSKANAATFVFRLNNR